MDKARSKVVAQTHTLSKVLLFSLIRCTWTLRHTRIAILGFVTHYLVQTPLQSESYVYISRLVKTRDPYPGLFQLAIVFLFSQSAFPLPSFSLESIFRPSLLPTLCLSLFGRGALRPLQMSKTYCRHT
jgi:hypothetical protein